jgi:hypothetical protein
VCFFRFLAGAIDPEINLRVMTKEAGKPILRMPNVLQRRYNPIVCGADRQLLQPAAHNGSLTRRDRLHVFLCFRSLGPRSRFQLGKEIFQLTCRGRW